MLRAPIQAAMSSSAGPEYHGRRSNVAGGTRVLRNEAVRFEIWDPPRCAAAILAPPFPVHACKESTLRLIIRV